MTTQNPLLGERRTSRDQHHWLRRAGCPIPRHAKESELLIAQIEQSWAKAQANERQERFLRLRERWHEDLTQQEAFERIGEIVVSEMGNLRTGGRMKWEVIVKLEPRLGDLLAEFSTKPDSATAYCQELAVNGTRATPGLKARLCSLVGWDAEQPGMLTTSEAYDLSFRKIVVAMPLCDDDCYCSKKNR